MSFSTKINPSREIRQFKTLLALVIMIIAIPAIIVFNPIVQTNNSESSLSNTTTTATKSSYDPYISDVVGQVVTTGYSAAVTVNPNMQLTVLVGLKFSQQNLLNNYLTNIQNPSSTLYHQYMTKQQFYDTFSPSLTDYTNLVNSFTKTGLQVSTFADRVSIKLVGTVSQFENAFHTTIQQITLNSKTFYAPTKSLKLSTDASSISSVIGLNNYYKAQMTTPISESVQLYENYLNNPNYSNNATFCNTYLGLNDTAQGGFCSNQLLVGSDMQPAYQINKLTAGGNYPYNETVATILWSGTNSTGSSVAPFYPADLVNYFSSTLPAGEPQPNVCGTYNQAINQSYICGVPVDGAYPQPDVTAKNDTSQSNFESTLDLEMAGSVAPGANVMEVYGPDGYSNYLDDCFATILNAPSSSPLYHTVAISNSWGIFDEPGPWGAIVDPLWNQYTQEASALGITVLASTGDNANIAGELPSIPASLGTNNYGVIAVGGTQTVLNGTVSTDGSGTIAIANQTAWFGTPYPTDGSQGGVSISYSEPIWQQQSFDAQNIIKSSEPQITGRGTPDISAVASNMNITISYYVYFANGSVQYNRVFRMLPLWGTSVASPLTAGVVAVMDHYLGYREGFFDSMIYQLGEAQIDGLFASAQPFNDVGDYSFNVLWFAYPGYDLVTGWGSINAYNFVIDQQTIKAVTFTQTGLPAGTSWSVTFDGATQSSTATKISFMAEEGPHTYSINTNGYISNINSGTVTMKSTNINVNIAFANSKSTGKGVTQITAKNDITNKALVNFTFTSPGPYSNPYTTNSGAYSSLPMSELFYVLHDKQINTVSLYLSGTGAVQVSIGTNLWQNDILAPITLAVSGTGWYTISFPIVTLQASIALYYLNVLSANTNSGLVNWGFINNATINKPSVSTNDIGSFNPYSMEYPYNAYGLDVYHPALYSLGLQSNPPAIEGPTGILTTSVYDRTPLSWKLASGIDSYGTQSYSIYKNGTLIASGTWVSNTNVTIMSKETDTGLFNYTIYVTDGLGGYAQLTNWVQVTGTNGISTKTQTVTNTKTKTSPGFELVSVVLALSAGILILLRKKNKN